MNYSLLLVASMVIAVQCYFIPMRFTHKRLVARESKYSRSNILVHMTDNDGDVGIADDEATVPETVDDLNITDATNQTEVVSTNATEVDPIALAITEEENRLRKKVQELESVLKSERLRSVKIRDKISEGGKTGFFIVQAQVAEFNKKKDAEQKSRVNRNKRDFVEKMLPVVDAFRNAREIAPAQTEKDENMHTSFASLLNGVINVFEKYGYKEYEAGVDERLDPSLHAISEIVEGEKDNVIVSTVRKGLMDDDGKVIRPALVVVSKVQKDESSEESNAESLEGSLEESLEDTTESFDKSGENLEKSEVDSETIDGSKVQE